ncbi:MAG TPA: ORF6N domain-containing protein [Candidatus Binatia bacterium]|jgi:hypothetical protein|nr:ORF6N domain-containing protein [Candidatus Binatia bacterium]
MAGGETAPIEKSILVVRGQRVILAADLAKIYGVETRVLNQAVKRNRERFPEDFTFRLTREEASAMAASRSQSVILKRGENIKYLPYVFTEHGAIMAANVLNSPHAVRMSVYVVRAFIRLRHTTKDRISRGGKGRSLRPALIATHFHVFAIAKTCKSSP